MSDIENDKHYVYHDTEVKLTGRTAIKRKRSGRNAGQVSAELYEVTPADIEEGSWKKWVRPDDLYEIIGKQS
jgi:hypothetical protein